MNATRVRQCFNALLEAINGPELHQSTTVTPPPTLTATYTLDGLTNRKASQQLAVTTPAEVRAAADELLSEIEIQLQEAQSPFRHHLVLFELSSPNGRMSLPNVNINRNWQIDEDGRERLKREAEQALATTQQQPMEVGGFL